MVERRFIVSYKCNHCPHIYRWGNGALGHVITIKASTLGEAVQKAEKDPYISREGITGVRETSDAS